jgi:hypothetical protein
MGRYLSLRSNEGGISDLVLVNNYTQTGYQYPRGTEWGDYDPIVVFASSIDSFGSTRAGGGIQSRELRLPLIVDAESATSSSTVAQNLADLHKQVVSIDQYQGQLRFRPENISKLVEWEIVAAKLEGDLWGPGAEVGSHTQVTLVLTVQPSCGLSMELEDSFTQNTIGTAGEYNPGGSDWTFDSGSSSDVSIASGYLSSPTGSSSTFFITHTGSAHSYSDCEVTSKACPGTTITDSRFGVMLKRISANNHLQVRVYDDGSSSLRIDKVTNGSASNLASTAISTRISNGTPFWVVGRIEGNNVYAEYWTTPPTMMGTPTHTASYTLTSTDATTWGKGVTGQNGIQVTWKHSGAKIYEWNVRPFAYKGSAGTGVNTPDVVTLNGGIGGDLPAKCNLRVADASNYQWAAFAWMPKPAPYNLVANGDIEKHSAAGWSNATVAGVLTASTSASAVTTGSIYQGATSLEIVCPATTDTGASFLIYQRFKKGVTYTVEMYAYSAAGTTNARCKLGVSGDIATSTSVALSATWTRHSTTWTPTADVDAAYFAATIAAATATTWRIDRVMVYEGTTAPADPAGGPVPWGVIPAQQSLNNGAYFTVSADADYRSGFNLAGSGAIASNASFSLYCPTWPLTADPYARGWTAIQIFARVEIASTQQDVVLAMSVRGSNSLEFGSAGQSVLAPTSGTTFVNVFCGTFMVPVDRSNYERVAIRGTFSNGASSTGTLGVCALYCIPSQRSVTYPYGLDSADAQSVVDDECVIRFDKSIIGVSRSATSETVTYSQGSGIGGANLLFPPATDYEVFAWLNDYIPSRTDDNATSADENTPAYIQVSPSPQQVILRP